MLSLIGRLQLRWRLLAFRGLWLLNTALAGLTLVMFILAPPESEAPWVAGGLLIVATFASLAVELRHTRRSSGALYFAPPEDSSLLMSSLQLPPHHIANGYEVLAVSGFAATYSKAVNAILSQSHLFVTQLGTHYSPPDIVGPIATCIFRRELSRGGVTFNEGKVRLLTDLLPDGIRAGSPLRVQRTDYFAGLLTNQVATDTIISNEDHTERFRGWTLVQEGGLLRGLDDSPLSNHIGVSTVAVTADKLLLCTVQTEKSRQSPGLRAPSGSGSATWRDFERSGNDFIAHAMEPELIEECTTLPLGRGALFARCRTRIVGYARMLHQGGKPEFFGVTRFGVESTRIRLRTSEKDFIADINPLRLTSIASMEIAEALASYRRTHTGLSFPLYLNLVFLEDYIRRAPNEVRAFLFD